MIFFFEKSISFENFNISTINIICVKAAKALWYYYDVVLLCVIFWFFWRNITPNYLLFFWLNKIAKLIYTSQIHSKSFLRPWELKNKKKKKKKPKKKVLGSNPGGCSSNSRQPFANELDLGVPMACWVKSTLVLQK